MADRVANRERNRAPVKLNVSPTRQ